MAAADQFSPGPGAFANCAGREPRACDAAQGESPGAQTQVSILVVEDEAIIAHDLRESLVRLDYRVAGVAGDGRQAILLAAQLQPQLILMDVTLPGEIDGIQAAQIIRELTPAPVIFLTARSDPATLQRAVSADPLGYILKPFQEVELRCAIEVAMHKHRADLELRAREEALRRSAARMENLSLLDELTQLKNRRGFFELAAQALKVARREHQALGLFFMDLNDLKHINDTLGHLAGDQALCDTADVLRQTFRDSDILARLGGDEFVALAHVARDVDALRGRLREHLAAFNATAQRPYVLDLSIGTALACDAGEQEDDLQSLLARADAAMYQEKRARRTPAPTGAPARAAG